MTNDDRWCWPDAGLTVMGLAAIVALMIGASGYLSPDLEITATRGFLFVCALSLALVVVAASLPILERGSHGPVAFFAVLCVLDLLGTSIAAFLLERPATIAAMAVAALGLTDHLMRPRAVATARSKVL
ncbi:MAG: hypothetical protein JO223_07665 [Hyphomicrobiales bacterium]|nr:hypothetical protein [Hyphomicrobiales bacterium]